MESKKILAVGGSLLAAYLVYKQFDKGGDATNKRTLQGEKKPIVKKGGPTCLKDESDSESIILSQLASTQQNLNISSPRDPLQESFVVLDSEAIRKQRLPRSVEKRSDLDESYVALTHEEANRG